MFKYFIYSILLLDDYYYDLFRFHILFIIDRLFNIQLEIFINDNIEESNKENKIMIKILVSKLHFHSARKVFIKNFLLFITERTVVKSFKIMI